MKGVSSFWLLVNYSEAVSQEETQNSFLSFVIEQ